MNKGRKEGMNEGMRGGEGKTTVCMDRRETTEVTQN